MLTKKQLDGLGLRETGRDDQGRLIADASELIEPAHLAEVELPTVNELERLLGKLSRDQLNDWIRKMPKN